MSRNEERTDPAALRMAADLTWAQHQPGGNIYRPGTCWQCTPGGCAQLRWAEEVRAGRNTEYPEPRQQPGAIGW
ncbi:hypothetical protein BDK92_6403 [Micromonospora pisi]|uniref:Uncharacterized protein n=1 Tax=Micromonospora pisi TaxID=589240 RepID=A0A495JUH1_9ACTN|nr:hypothetical protein [Micromonospora pisi]RKR91972.1 hypothetical protein BDK92_6403 [Micromonospora pisi]